MSGATPSMTTERTSRLNMRVAPRALEIIREAAAAQQQDVTSFVLGAALDRSRSVLIESAIMRLTPSEADRLETALDEDPRVVPELADLLRAVKGGQVQRRVRAAGEV